MKKSLMLCALLALSGCANLKLQWSASYQTDNFAADLAAIRSAQEPAPKPISYRIGK